MAQPDWGQQVNKLVDLMVESSETPGDACDVASDYIRAMEEDLDSKRAIQLIAMLIIRADQVADMIQKHEGRH